MTGTSVIDGRGIHSDLVSVAVMGNDTVTKPTHRKLYDIVGITLDKVYQNNVPSLKQPSYFELFNTAMSIGPLLVRWGGGLSLRVRAGAPESGFEQVRPEQSIGDMLGLVLRLRYLHTRMLLHRQMIVCFLRYESSHDFGGGELEFLRTFGRTSLEVCLRSAIDTLDLLNDRDVPGAHPQTLTSWWFQVCYGEHCIAVVGVYAC